jgi:hypothetical protein
METSKVLDHGLRLGEIGVDFGNLGNKKDQRFLLTLLIIGNSLTVVCDCVHILSTWNQYQFVFCSENLCNFFANTRDIFLPQVQ